MLVTLLILVILLIVTVIIIIIVMPTVCVNAHGRRLIYIEH